MAAGFQPKKAAAARTAGESTAQFEALLRHPPARGRYVLKLYVTGTTRRSAEAVANIRALCEQHLAGRYDLEVIDIYQQPGQAVGEQILAAPTLVRKLPAPARRVIGDLSNRERVLVALDVRDPGAPPGATQWMSL
jgi:circadian clock protein KaiB